MRFAQSVLVRFDAQKRPLDLLPVVDAPTVRTVALARIQRRVVAVGPKAIEVLVQRVAHADLSASPSCARRSPCSAGPSGRFA